MCLRPTVILSQKSLLYNKQGSVYFYENSYGISDIFSNPDIRHFLCTYNECTPEEIHEVVHHSYLIHNGVKCPLFCLLPCGKCSLCKYDYKREVESRCILEACNSGTTIFYTLTYSSLHAPRTGLNRTHVVSAFKRLRTYIERYLDTDIHFTHLYVGEYGTNPKYSLRPHYHGLLFFDKPLSTKQLSDLRELFQPTQKCYDEHLNSATYSEYMRRNIHVGKFYLNHPRLKGFWPHGVFFDFQTANNPVALVRYVSKYITKNIYTNSQFAIDKEIDESHWTNMFLQLPKSIGLACKYIDLYKDYILNSTSPTLTVKYTNSKGFVQYCRTKIPKIYIDKLFPTIGKLCPNIIFNAHVVKSLIDYTSKHIYFHSKTSPYLLSNEDLQKVITDFEPYIYLTNFSLKRKEKLKLDTVIGCITGVYHNIDYQK